MTGGSLFRIAAGGSSFLLPLMLQVGFGLSAAQSGALTFAGAAGALLMRSGATLLVRRIGFRRLLVIDAAVSAALICLVLLLTPATSRLLMLGLFFAVGFCRSLMFLCVNTMGYADVPEHDMSHATSFAGTAQQLGLTVGVAITAQVLHVSAMAQGRETLAIADFHVAWIVIVLLTLSSLLVFRRLPADAGSSVSGYRRDPD
jgi:nitrate/nitrite transporter NarK